MTTPQDQSSAYTAFKKYKAYPPVNLTDRTWPDQNY